MAKVFYANAVKKAFAKLWKLSGRPTLKVIPPITAWTVPAGVTYDPHMDQFVNNVGSVVSVSWQTQSSTELNFLPDHQSLQNLSLDMAGLVSTEGMNVVVQWSPETAALLKVAWGVAIDGKLYRIDRYEVKPAGVVSPTDIAVSLVDAK